MVIYRPGIPESAIFQMTPANLFSESDMLPCLSRQLLGISCPGCGLQRAVALLLRGEWVDSFLMYPALLPMIVLFGFILADLLVGIRKGTRIISILAVTTVAAILINYLIKLTL